MMRAAWLATGLLLLLTGPLRAAPGLEQELDALAREAGQLELGLRVEAQGGAVVYARGDERPLVPASNMKLLTTAAALDRLGPDFSHRTALLLAGQLAGDVLRGDLFVVGGGDPTISRRFDRDPLLDEVAAAVAGAGVRRVSGDLVLDDRAFDDVRLHPDWDRGDAEHWYGAEVCALSLNDNCLDVAVGGGERAPTVTLLPDTGYVQVVTEAQLIPGPKGHVFSLQRRGEDRRTLVVRGKVWRGAKPYESSVPVADPAAFFGAVLRERLAARGVTLDGEVRRARGDEAPQGALAWERRAPLPRTLAVTNRHSQNLYAECLLKTLGRLQPDGTLAPGGTWERGGQAVEAWARGLGIAAGEVRVADGSGLARTDRLSARALVTVLRAALDGPQGQVFRDSLATPGEPGTLRRRLTDLPAGVSLRAKTGTLTGVAALSGELEAGGRRWRFSLLANGKGASARLLDRCVRVLAGHLARGG